MGIKYLTFNLDDELISEFSLKEYINSLEVTINKLEDDIYKSKELCKDNLEFL
jgi:hypothetical protein